MEHPTPYSVTTKKLPNSRVEMHVVISAEAFDKTRTAALRHIGKDLELPGFRKGHVPENILAHRVGEAAILEEMAEITIGNTYPEIVIAEKLDVIGRPDVRITKIAMGNPLECTITSAVFPEFTLPDYKKIAQKEGATHSSVEVDEKEVDKAIEELRKMRGERERAEGLSGDEVHDVLPEVDDAFAATLGNFSSITELRVAIKENMKKEKEREAVDKRRVAIMEKIAEATKMELPDLIIDEELHRMKDEFAHDVARMGLDLPKYLEAVKKTESDIMNEWRPEATKRATIQILLGRIAETEKIEPEAAAVEREAAALKQRYPDADESRITGYVRMLLTNDATLKFLENVG